MDVTLINWTIEPKWYHKICPMFIRKRWLKKTVLRGVVLESVPMVINPDGMSYDVKFSFKESTYDRKE